MLQAVLCLPQTVEVAVLAGVEGLRVGLELSHGLVARSEILAQHLVLGHQLNPLDEVGLGHGMLHRTYDHAIAALDLLHHGNMFLGSCVSGVLHQQFQITSKLSFACVQYLNKAARSSALIDFVSFCHNLNFNVMFDCKDKG